MMVLSGYRWFSLFIFVRIWLVVAELFEVDYIHQAEWYDGA